jgi:hypothetical protein
MPLIVPRLFPFQSNILGGIMHNKKELEFALYFVPILILIGGLFGLVAKAGAAKAGPINSDIEGPGVADYFDDQYTRRQDNLNQITIPVLSDWGAGQIAFTHGSEGEWDYYLWGGFANSLIKRNGTYYLYYQGSPVYDNQCESVSYRGIGVAKSADGVNWVKSGNNPVISWASLGSVEEGAASSAAWIGADGRVYVYYGANTGTGCDVNASARLAVSDDGENFQDLGEVLSGSDPNVWGSGDEIFPVGVYSHGNQWNLYYIPNGVPQSRRLGVAVGNGYDTFTQSMGLNNASIPAWGPVSIVLDNADAVLFTNPEGANGSMAIFRFAANNPSQVIFHDSYAFSDCLQVSVIFDSTERRWMMSCRSSGHEYYVVKHAYTGVINDPTPAYSVTPSFTPTATSSSTNTVTITPTRTITPTPSRTPTQTPGSTATLTPSVTNTQLPPSATLTPVCFQLTINHTGEGASPVASPTNSMGCDAGWYVAGASVNLGGAVPAIGWQIGGWAGTNNNAGTASTNSVTMPAGSHTVQVNYIRKPVASTWYLAEGYTGAGFETYILIQNPNNEPTLVDITYMIQNGGVLSRGVIVPANSRRTIIAQDAGQVGLDQAFSTKLQADQPIIVERAMYWPNGNGTLGGHVTTGIRQPETTWYLAEGYTGSGFSTFILLQNPNVNSTNVEVVYMLQGGMTETRTLEVPGNGRFTIMAKDPAQLGSDKAFSTKISAALPIVVERSMYFHNEGHAAGGVVAAHNIWYLAEGHTGSGFGTFILIQNPNTLTANVEVTYMLQTGGTVTRNILVPPNSRSTIVAQDATQIGTEQAFSTRLVSNQPIIVERAMYWQNFDGAIGGHGDIGNFAAGTTWYLAEGYTGGGFQTFILLQNPNSQTTEVDIIYMLQGGDVETRTIVVPGNSRYTIPAHDPGQIGVGVAFSTKLVSDLPIIVERSMYFPNGGHAAVGVILAP